MSSFSNGVLTVAQHIDVVKTHMAEGSYIVADANDWICYLRRDPFGLGSNIPIQEAMPEVMRMSEESPMLLLDHPEDHGWHFSVISGGHVLSTLDVPYEEACMSREEIEEIHNDPLMQEIGYRPPFFDPVQRLKGVSIDSFALFGLEEERRSQLRELFIPDNFRRETIFSMPHKFKEILHIYLEFTSWEKVDAYGEESFTILARK